MYSTREKIGKPLLRCKPIKKEYEKQILKYYEDSQKKNIEKWKPYGPLFTQIPDDGLSYEECEKIISRYTELTLENIKDKQFSGTIYPNNTNINTSWIKKDPNDDIYQQLQKLYAKIFVNSNLWNSLHDGDFPATAIINYQLVSMVADLFGGHPHKIMGTVTSGGTQSIMTAARSYCTFGVLEKDLDPTQCVIIAPQTIHSSLMKAADAYKFQLVLLPTDKNGRVDPSLLKGVVDYYKKNLVALFCSYPSYPFGTVDDCRLFAKLAQQYKVGLHIDCCLGGFILNFARVFSKLLEIDGVTSVSADTHKNGLAPKGSSVLMCKNIGNHNLMYYSIYTTIDWPGGLYGTPKDEGSQSIVEAFCALITLLMIGKTRYSKFAREINKTCKSLAQDLSQFDGIKVINNEHLNVVAFHFDEKFKNGSTYKLCDLLKEKGFILNSLLDDKIHLCVTNRFSCDSSIYEKFMEAFKECYETVKDKQNEEMDGSARLYCSVDNMLKPQKNGLSITKYLENLFLGRLGVRDSIRYHFLSILNPYYSDN